MCHTGGKLPADSTGEMPYNGSAGMPQRSAIQGIEAGQKYLGASVEFAAQKLLRDV
jgi:hypothetical protein